MTENIQQFVEYEVESQEQPKVGSSLFIGDQHTAPVVSVENLEVSEVFIITTRNSTFLLAPRK